ncbi:hypothetical protein [Archangium violaceum]|uniref:Uncharacterized protein n=1 Tax=Archangium violaceum Cb vi76 TaxID=1406225 RepID=A0A084SV88_9BACT|nr:hypothetical protein [Archangium violaceum]KFA92373.1 hypothetical protein Q664_15955 [Archangium violaceum Cb vi76]
MSENTTEELAEDSDADSENQNLTARVLVHVFVLGVLAVVAGAITSTPSNPGSMLPLDGLFDMVLWIGFAVYTLISSLGVICWRSWDALLGTHVAAGVLSLPAAGFLIALFAG